MIKWETIELADQLSPTPPKVGNWVRTDRARVVGGWLVRTVLIQREVIQLPGGAVDPEINSSIGLAFVPDSTWTWSP